MNRRSERIAHGSGQLLDVRLEAAAGRCVLMFGPQVVDTTEWISTALRNFMHVSKLTLMLRAESWCFVERITGLVPSQSMVLFPKCMLS